LTHVNVEAADRLVSVLQAWGDMTEDEVKRIHPDFDPHPDTYQEDLERFLRKHARAEADQLHPEGAEMVKAAMRWVMRDAPDFAEDWYSASLCDLDDPPQPRVRLWHWAWDAAFAEEPWDIPGEEFELYSDHRAAIYVTVANWDRRPPPDRRPFVWHAMPLDYP
jgi:hypothetical protein